MTPSTDNQTAAPALGLVSDPPPVGRFFVAFCALLALALGLAVLVVTLLRSKPQSLQLHPAAQGAVDHEVGARGEG